MGFITGTILRAPMVETRSDSTRRGRPITSTGALDAETGSILLAVEMMSEDVETWHRGYVSTTQTQCPHVLSADMRDARQRIQ